MAKAIFTEEFHFTSMKRNAGWSAYPKPEPQYYPREFIDAAVKAGRATEVKPSVRKGRASAADRADEPGS
ncbi:hypothetical protein [Paracoccus laeviglucosivorans]|uniref:Uncharacterized protein n=1 Tax=Paracoccus laeviglucosivorans TaxID=1197861 RepID=A0A521E641_9RHOB|nr:hypothetical protein [Paracoccus laeviglucosivorans]SMO78861.1 hypothetical protein SAMN06265221_11151 [Paracoccus laeviglucosivorans]